MKSSGAHLLARGDMNAGGGHPTFPLREKQVLRRKALEAPTQYGHENLGNHARKRLGGRSFCQTVKSPLPGNVGCAIGRT